MSPCHTTPGSRPIAVHPGLSLSCFSSSLMRRRLLAMFWLRNPSYNNNVLRRPHSLSFIHRGYVYRFFKGVAIGYLVLGTSKYHCTPRQAGTEVEVSPKGVVCSHCAEVSYGGGKNRTYMVGTLANEVGVQRYTLENPQFREPR
jgi:hypothetical protein